MKTIELLYPRFLGSGYKAQGETVEVDNWRADELVSLGQAKYTEADPKTESSPDPTVSAVPLSFKPVLGQAVDATPGTLSTTPDPPAAPGTATGPVSTDTTTGAGPEGPAPVVQEPVKPSGGFSAARAIG